MKMNQTNKAFPYQAWIQQIDGPPALFSLCSFFTVSRMTSHVHTVSQVLTARATFQPPCLMIHPPCPASAWDSSHQCHIPSSFQQGFFFFFFLVSFFFRGFRSR